MKHKHILLKIHLTLAILCGLIALLPLPCSAAPLRILAGTSNIADVVQQIAGQDVAVTTIIPGGACPGHYDIRPGDITILSQADAIVLHPWQQQQANIRSLLDAANHRPDTVTLVPVKGSWLIPEVEQQAITSITEILQRLHPEQADHYANQAKQCLARVQQTRERIRNQLTGAHVAGVPVICAVMQEDFVTWAGFRVVATYGRPEELSPLDLANLVATARQNRVRLFIDNLQSGQDAALSMARESHAAQVTITNFVHGLPATDTWEATVQKNIDLLLAALQQPDHATP
jgi:zinc transport system substrate-binding protein